MKITDVTPSKKKILIIDDENDICFILSIYLSSENCQVEFACTLSEGIKKLKLFNPDLLFLDNSLPDGWGIKKIKKIKEIAPQLYITMMSAYDSQKDLHTALSAGCNSFISKPFTRDEILKQLSGI
jgi:DNA-binding response OmpR family regulator